VTLDADVQPETDPETGEDFRLKGKTDIPRAREIIEEENDDWDDEIEDNLSLKLAEQEEYLRMQGIIAKAEEEPLLRRPNFQSVSKPTLPVLNRPVYDDNVNLTSLRRPNLTKEEKIKTEESINGCHESKNDSDTIEERCRSINNGVIPDREVLTRVNLDLHNNTSHNLPNEKTSIRVSDMSMSCTQREFKYADVDNESLASDSSWTSSIYQPIKRNPNKNTTSNPYSNIRTNCNEACSSPIDKNELQELSSCSGVTNSKSKHGIARGKLFKALERSLDKFTMEPKVVGRSPLGVQSSVMNSFEPPKKGLGRGNLKLAAMNFQVS